MAAQGTPASAESIQPGIEAGKKSGMNSRPGFLVPVWCWEADPIFSNHDCGALGEASLPDGRGCPWAPVRLGQQIVGSRLEGAEKLKRISSRL